MKEDNYLFNNKKYKILFVCLGNICRSPLAEAVMKKLVKDAGMADRFLIDSAGIIGYHEGEPADPRMRAHAILRGYRLDSISRPVRIEDFYDFDLIIGMDNRNVDDLKEMASDPNSEKKVHQMMEYATNRLYDYVPDPYYSGAEGFELVLDLLEDACRGLPVLFLLQVRITDAGVIHDLQLLDEDLLDGFHIPEGERSVLQQSVGNLRLDDLIDQLLNTFHGVFFQAA